MQRHRDAFISLEFWLKFTLQTIWCVQATNTYNVLKQHGKFPPTGETSTY